MRLECEQLIRNREEWRSVNKKNRFNIDGLLSGLYDDPSHFVYELLQNAEDAGATIARFKLTKKSLELWHDGKDFNFGNIDAITGIGISTKKTDLNAIGKFGVGFKSVFAVTKTPVIRSGAYDCEIVDFVVPRPLEETSKKGTLIELPFNNPKKSEEETYNMIKGRLRELGLETLMFLKNTRKIECIIDGEIDVYYSKTERKNGARWVRLIHEKNKNTIAEEEWLIMERTLEKNTYLMRRIKETESFMDKTDAYLKKLKVEIAFMLETDENGKKHIINLESNRSNLSAFFLTKIRTGLYFIIQGPYRTTPARDNIPFEDEWNRQLIFETAKLLVDSISHIKELGMLDIAFLNVLPLDEEILDNGVYPIYESVKEKLSSDEKLLPNAYGSFSSIEESLIARGKDLINLLSQEELEDLFGRDSWLSSEITKDRNGYLWTYLTKVLEIPEIRPEDFIIKVDKAFIQKRSDEWMLNFYKYLTDKEKLWKDNSFKFGWEEHMSVRLKPIIRLEDGSHMPPFTKEGAELVYLPTGDKHIDQEFDVIKKSIAKDQRAVEFFKKLNLKEPDVVARVYEKIIPKYRPVDQWLRFEEEDNKDDRDIVGIEENISDIEAILEAITKYWGDNRLSEIKEQLQDCECLLAKNMGTGEQRYVSPRYVFLGGDYTGSKNIEAFYSGNKNAWLLDECYKEQHISNDDLKKIGCLDDIYLNPITPDEEFIYIMDEWPYVRGHDGFDPRCKIEGLDWALENMNYERSIILWKFLMKHYKKIFGTIEKSSRKDFSSTAKTYEKKQIYSEMGKLLVENEWLYRNNNSPPVKPKDISIDELSIDYDKESQSSKFLSQQLRLKIPLREKMKDKLSKEEEEYLEMASLLINLGISKEELEDLISNKEKQARTQVNTIDATHLSEEFEEALTITKNGSYSDEDYGSILPGITPEEEKEIEDVNGKKISEILKNLKLKKKSKTTMETETIGSIDVEEFLISEYDGRCQICNTRLFSGNKNNKRQGLEFVTTRIIERKNTRAYSDMEWNVLCLCPNHFALFKHGKRDLRGIWKLAEDVISGNVAPEFVPERGNTDYYIAKIKMMSEEGEYKETEIYYKPAHIRKITALLKEGGRNKSQEYEGNKI